MKIIFGLLSVLSAIGLFIGALGMKVLGILFVVAAAGAVLGFETAQYLRPLGTWWVLSLLALIVGYILTAVFAAVAMDS